MARSTRLAPLYAVVAALASVFIVVGLTSCFESRTVECSGGVICPEGSVCTADGMGCTNNSCGNGDVDSGEECDDGNHIATDDCKDDCTLAECGDGITHSTGTNTEECDDNAADTENCDSDCTLPVCGDDHLNEAADEICDDGNTDSNDNCKNDCSSTEQCNNGVIDSHLPNNPTNNANCLDATATGTNCAEVCDDGNNIAGDGCSPNCLSLEDCGNGIRDTGENCDDGDLDNEDVCRNDCSGGAGCGNGDVEGGLGEQCDNGSTNDSLTCDGDCTIPLCGDGRLNMSLDTMSNPLEECDPGTPSMPSIGQPSPNCNANCTVPACGDSIVNDEFVPPGSTLTENCDDGNTMSGDGCDNRCRIEGCGNGVTEMSRGEACDDGNTNDLDACRNNCQVPRCGDGIASTPPNEICDTNGNTSTCDFDCTAPLCGDSLINTSFIPPGGTLTESCDDGNTMGGDGCSALCRIENCGNGITENLEQCDDGNMVDTDGCRNSCRLPACGDGIESDSEICDENGNTQTCDSNCTMPACGDNLLNTAFTPTGGSAPENCDDGGTANGDGCSSLCRIESTTLTVFKTGTGTGTVTSPGINCGTDCSEPYVPNAMVTLTAAPTGLSYFVGWSGGGCSGTGTCTVTMDATKTVTATFDLNTLTLAKAGAGQGTVTSNLAGINCGTSCTSDTGDYAAATMVTLTATANSTSTFMGWSGGGCSGTNPCTVTMNAATTVTATFELQTFTLSLSKGSSTGFGTVQSAPTGIDCGRTCTSQSFGFTANTSVTLFATPDSDSTFTGWSGGVCSGTANCITTMSQARSVTATFTIKQFVLTLNKAGDGEGTVTSSPSGINCNDACSSDTGTYNAGTSVTLTPVAAAGDIFMGWSGGGCSGTGPCVTTIDAATTVTATFNDNRVTILRVGDGSGTVTGPTGHGSSQAGNGINCGSNCYDDYNPGTSITLTATATAGSRFNKWVDGPCANSTLNTCTFNVNAPVTIEVEFTDLDVVTVNKSGAGAGSVTSNPAGISCGPLCSTANASFDDGATITLTAAAEPGSTFISWSGGGCSGNGTCVINTIQTDQTVTANFALAGTITINKTGSGSANGTVTNTAPSGTGINCGSDCSEVFANATSVTLSVSVPSGTVFTGWSNGSGTCTGTTTPCTFAVAGDRTIGANFEVMRTLTVTVNGDGGGDVDSTPSGINNCTSSNDPCTAQFANGTSITLAANPNGNSVFAGWTSTACSGTGDCVFTITADTAVTATINDNTSTLTIMKPGLGTGTVTATGINCDAANTDCIGTFTNGTQVTVTASAAGGSIFTGWGAPCEGAGTGNCVFTINTDTVLVANFAQAFTLTVATNGGAGTGTVASTDTFINCPGDCSQVYASGTSVTLSASPDANMAFTGWSGGSGTCTGTTSPCTMSVTATGTVTATFVPTFALNVTATGSGQGSVTSSPGTINCAAPSSTGTCSNTFNSGTSVTLTATPTGNDTVVWSGDCTPGVGNTCVASMTAAANVTATFTDVFTLTVTVTGTGTVSADTGAIMNCAAASGVCAGNYSTGTTVTLTPSAGQTAWGGACSAATVGMPCAVTMDAAKSVTAAF